LKKLLYTTTLLKEETIIIIIIIIIIGQFIERRNIAEVITRALIVVYSRRLTAITAGVP